MRIDQNGHAKRTDLGCDDLPPIEAQQRNGSLLRSIRYFERSLDDEMDVIVRKGGNRRRLHFNKNTPTMLGLSLRSTLRCCRS